VKEDAVPSNQQFPRSHAMLALLATLLALGLPVAAAAEDADALPPLADVAFYRADELRSSIEVGPGPAAEPQLAWEQVLDSGVNGDPILVAGLLIVADQDGHLIALDARTGEETWRATGDGAFAGAPAASAGIVVAADPTSVRAFDVASGAERWHRGIASDAPRIEIADGVVYVGTVDGGVRGLDLTTGEDRWSWQGDHTLSVRVDLVADGVVYANPNDGRLLAIDLSDGSERWRFLSRAPRLAYGLAGDTVFVTNPVSDESVPVGQIAAIDALTGRVRWRFVGPSGDQVGAGPYEDGILYVDSHQDGIYALRDEGGTYSIVWHTDAPEMRRVLTLVGDTLYGAGADGSLLALRAEDGSLLWRTTIKGSSVLPIISGGMIFTAGDGPIVQAFADADLIARLPNRILAEEPSAPTVAELPDPFRVVRSTPLEDLGVTLGPGGAVTMPDAAVSMTVGPDGMLYVIDAASVVTVIDPAIAAVVRRFGRHGAGEGEFDYGSIAAAPDGRLYVLDYGNKRIQVLDSDGTYLGQLGSFGEAEGQFVSPLHLEVDASGSVYLLEGPNGLISKFDSEGGFIWRVGGPSADPRLASAYDLAVMKDGTILVTLEFGGPALLLDPDDGSIVGSWGDESVGWSAEPVVDPAGNVVLFQYGPPGIQGGAPAMRMFDPEGRPLGIRDLKDTPPGPERFYPTPVFASDGYGYSFGGSQGLVRLEVALP
jgi:outer membrane protein assembly factor BamB